MLLLFKLDAAPHTRFDLAICRTRRVLTATVWYTTWQIIGLIWAVNSRSMHNRSVSRLDLQRPRRQQDTFRSFVSDLGLLLHPQ
jgi:hypothetical protein